MKPLIQTQRDELIDTLHNRFLKNMHRHASMDWQNIVKKLDANPSKLNALYAMEESGGEVDVVAYDPTSDVYTFMDCSKETPKGRLSLCYDPEALASRKANKPSGSAIGMANEMGVELLDETQYRYLQTLGEFDIKTSTWIKSPDAIRKLGGALFCDRRYDMVFTYHNGAESYYGARGFRAFVTI